MRRLLVLFVGDPARARGLRDSGESHGVSLCAASDVEEALAFYVVYMPDVVILEEGASEGLAREIHLHLSSLGAGPTVVLVGGADPGAWKDRAGEMLRLLTDDATDEELLALLRQVADEMPSAFRAISS